MNSHIEEEKILTFGNKSIDVSNVSYGRIVKASTTWNEAVEEDTDPTITEKERKSLDKIWNKKERLLRKKMKYNKLCKETIEESIFLKKENFESNYIKRLPSVRFNKMVEDMGIYLIRQDFDVLTFRFTLKRAIKEYIKRLLLTAKHINKSNKDEYEEFQDWIYFILTGKKKDRLEAQADLMGDMAIMYRDLKRQGISLETCLKLLPTLVTESQKA